MPHPLLFPIEHGAISELYHAFFVDVGTENVSLGRDSKQDKAVNEDRGEVALRDRTSRLLSSRARNTQSPRVRAMRCAQLPL